MPSLPRPAATPVSPLLPPLVGALRCAALCASLCASLFASLAACSSSSQRKDTQVPSEMLGPSEGGAAAAPAQPAPAGEPGEAGEPAATGEPGEPAAATGSATLTVEEKTTAGELAIIMKDVTAQFERLVLGLEQAGADCKKAAASLDGARKGSAPVEERMKAFRSKLQSKGQPSQALMAELQKVTLEAFPTALRARADSTFERLDKQCASDAEFQRAKKETVEAQAGG